ncbi:MAG: CoB--CoM heterodisulfide reductase iron-sulfur subunit A family protein [Deltaproteobacteria bacterium]|nr:CoB--CoM heterodisulfide reductase iron-sulfur subunit A family protein [Deltaproteobacteria bacterium]MBW2048138.1 CoB--CoM heterodisulfide reductase iron-sulfur subunit A family protein [Deltaproteobacteria bacterium]MBW2110878.1 CoB--CoM heterodisulfide reductase iron-sulfur subunit A family protein [Deltaproteobacteria bacterium]HDZ91287.1 CoB--CoM heterodisulfide reductase iron-sulfur subunit A family protein [Deltaproteobacteria bacterium]
MSQDKPKGPVAVIGGGIAGIQAALSLSDAGYGVHLIERSGSLGGIMPGLHRFYPLCACCKVDPRIAACEQDPNINVMLNTELSGLSGVLGDFTVSFETEDRKGEVKAGAVVLAAGIDTFDPSEHETYPHEQLPNVITSLEYEQLQKPLGPGGGELKRPSDGRKPEKIAWLQCVGSRDINQCDAPYCSSVCCMYALKEAVNTKDIDEDIETTIFYMDMRTHGKGFEDYLNSAVDRDVRLIRSRVHTVDTLPGTDDLLIRYADKSGHPEEEPFDMVVLSVGLRPASEAIKIADRIGLNLTADHFVSTEPFRPVSTSLPGVFVCGGLSGPHDIGQSLVQATATVSEIGSILDPEPFAHPAEYPHMSDAADKDPAILLAYHLCPGMAPEFGPRIEEYGLKTPGVKTASMIEGDILEALTAELKRSGANRLLFASCSPVVHKGLVEEALRSAGLNPYLYDLVDLRAMDPQSSSIQIQDRIRMGAARALLLSPPTLREIPVVKNALVVGAGITGLESALALSREGYPVTVVEKEKEAGGHGLHVRKTWQGYDTQEYLKKLRASVHEDKNITLMTETRVVGNRGFAGNFVTTLDNKGEKTEISHGVTVLAPGGNPLKPEEYLYGQHHKVFLWSELERKLMEDPASLEGAETAVFIQCVGSRDSTCSHCSNICCTFSVRTAVDLKAKNPDMGIYILYRDMRTFGERENLYREARERGVVFIRYELDNKPVLRPTQNGERLSVTVYDQVLQGSITFETDFVSLQTAIRGTENRDLAEIFRVDTDQNGFFAESPEKLMPVDSTNRGIYMAGLAAYPKDMVESIAQAKAASARALEILSRDTIQVGGMVAEVMAEKCAVCCTCVRTCPFSVPVIDHQTGAAFIDPGLCQGCGMCVAECPGKAITMCTCSDQMLTQAPSILLGT